MQPNTREHFNKYLRKLGELNACAVQFNQQFTVAPSVQQRLETKMQDSSAFLKEINMVGVVPQLGQKVFVGVDGFIASTTNTDATDRNPRDPTTTEGDEYLCAQTNWDTFQTYAQLDAWAMHPDFQARVRDSIIQRQALDRIAIGFNGTHRAATSNRTANPLGQDVNTGWLQQYRNNAPDRVFSASATRPGATGIRVGDLPGADYVTLDALVYDAINHYIDPWWREDPRLRVNCSRLTVADKYFPLMNKVQRPEDMMYIDVMLSQKRMGGLQVAGLPFFPEGKMLITMPANLSLYWQIGSRRRTVLDWPKRSRWENYESSNDAYVVELYGAGCLIENIVQPVQQVDGDGHAVFDTDGNAVMVWPES